MRMTRGAMLRLMSAATPEASADVRISRWVYAVAIVYFAAQMATSTRYGYFRDALYYLTCSHHLAFGYVDLPPLFPFVAWIGRHTLGTSLPALIFWPALAGAARIVLVALFARELGAGAFGTVLAAVLGTTPGVWWVIDHQFAMNAFEPLFWIGLALVVLRMIKTGNPRLWLVFGLVAGLGVENKYSIAFFAFALLLGVLLSPARKLLFTPWILAGGAIAFGLFLPNLIWNVQHHWPFLELMHNIRVTGKDVILPPGAYLAQQVLMMNPASLPFWFAGLLYYFARGGRAYRAFGWTFVITIFLFMAMHGKDYYSAPAYTLVLAAGGLAGERLLERVGRPGLRAILRSACFAWLIIFVVLLLPLVLPVLSLEAFVRYQSHLPFQPAKTERSFAGAVLPQYYADELPWEEMVAAVARVYHALPAEQQARTGVFGNNYGEAAAVDFFGPKYGLPQSISGHQNYFFWGPRNYTGESLIVLGDSVEGARRSCASVEIGATLNNPYALFYENRPVLLCRGLRWNLQTDWQRMKFWR